MSLHLFDSRCRGVRPFTPRIPNSVSAYVCGITPNNATHLGHAFTYVQFDVLRRLLLHAGYEVHYLQNATDINDSDDVIVQAKERGMTWDQLAAFWVEHFQRQMKALHVLPPTTYMFATSAMDQIIEMIRVLIDTSYAYVVDGMVYFDVSKAGSYGELSGLNAVEMDQISRQRGGDPDDRRKKNSQDFVLWFASSEEPNWRAPWGVGRPGWHIECSAMIQQVLGDQIDIHGGGADLIYPHHESEIAQSEAYTHKVPYVQYWMHIAMVRYEGEKMSKSLGNLVLVEDLLKNYEANALRLLLLSNHYRTSWEYTETLMKKSAERWSLILARCHEADAGDLSDIIRALEDDLHTDRAVELLQTMSGASLRNALTLMGFLIEDAS